MSATRNLTGFAVCFILPMLCLTAAPAHANDQADTLGRAIALFEDGKYLAAQELLLTVDRGKLGAKARAQRDDYLNRIQVAVTMEDKALRDLEDAETAVADGQTQRARHLLNAVLSNDYAAEPLRVSARSKLNELGGAQDDGGTGDGRRPTRRGAVTMATQGDAPAAAQDAKATPNGNVERATALTAAGDELARTGQFDGAEVKYRDALTALPGFPEAVDGLERVRQFRENAPAAGVRSLIDQIRQEDAINWQRTVSQYREIERMIREHVAAERFEEAQQFLVRARQIVESGRHFADPVVKYENLRRELEALSSRTASASRLQNERKVAELRKEIEEQRSQKLRQIEDRRASQVDLLMQEAMQHRKNGDYEAAIGVLRQIAVIDPQNQSARWIHDILDDQLQYRRQRETANEYSRRVRDALIDVERAKVPWYRDEPGYPDNWPELITRPERQLPSHDRRNSRLQGALESSIDVDFPKDPFHRVIEKLVEAHRINLVVNWHDLKNAGVDPDVEINLVLPNQISLKKALTEVLDQAGAGVADLGFEAVDGVVTIATQHTIDTRTHMAVYPITDLLMNIPSFKGPRGRDLRDASQPTIRINDSADLPWRHGDDDDNEPDEDVERQTRVQQLIELIQETVAPDSWRDRGGTIGTIREINGQLVITQNTASQRQIGGLLDKLREQRAIQIAVEAIFLTVSSHYLEELGLDLDIVLNAGNAGLDFLNTGNSPSIDPVLGSRLLLPRTFSRLGFTPNTPGLGTATTTAVAVNQPFTQPFLVPQQAGGSGSQWTPIPIRTGLTDFTNPALLGSDISGSFAGQTIGPALSILGSFLDNIQVDFLIRATQADSRTTVMAAPRLVVFNGGSAWVAVTVQTNFISQLQPVVAQGAVAQAPTVGTIDAGASLFVRATVTADRRYVMLLLAPGVTRLIGITTLPFSGGTGNLTDAFIQLPQLSTQRVMTMVSVPDGGTLLIGGQKLANETEVEAGVPILSKIPILKRAYTARTLVKDEQTLLILIKPKILIHSEQEQLAFPSFSQG